MEEWQGLFHWGAILTRRTTEFAEFIETVDEGVKFSRFAPAESFFSVVQPTPKVKYSRSGGRLEIYSDNVYNENLSYCMVMIFVSVIGIQLGA